MQLSLWFVNRTSCGFPYLLRDVKPRRPHRPRHGFFVLDIREHLLPWSIHSLMNYLHSPCHSFNRSSALFAASVDQLMLKGVQFLPISANLEPAFAGDADSL